MTTVLWGSKQRHELPHPETKTNLEEDEMRRTVRINHVLTVAVHKPCRTAAPRSLRHGSVLVVAMVALLLTSLILGSLLRMASLQHRQLRSEQDLLQADWLAESALDRAAARLASEPSYSGETWNIPAREIGGRSAGRVTISVKQSADQPTERSVLVSAVYPFEETIRGAKRSKQVIVTVIAKP